MVRVEVGAQIAEGLGIFILIGLETGVPGLDLDFRDRQLDIDYVLIMQGGVIHSD